MLRSNTSHLSFLQSRSIQLLIPASNSQKAASIDEEFVSCLDFYSVYLGRLILEAVAGQRICMLTG